MTQDGTTPRDRSDRPPARLVIESVLPQVDGGRFPIKRVTGERVEVEAKIFTEGHDHVAAVLRHRPRAGGTARSAKPDARDAWAEVRMRERRFVFTSVRRAVWRTRFLADGVLAMRLYPSLLPRGVEGVDTPALRPGQRGGFGPPGPRLTRA